MRFGKHPDYSRVVIETASPIENARVSKIGNELVVSIDIKR
jgi:hypothetical protein